LKNFNDELIEIITFPAGLGKDIFLEREAGDFIENDRER
jgi:hypothetical protein